MPVSRPLGPIKTKTFPPWGVLAIDLLGPLPIDESISVVVDYYSRYYEINILRSTVASKVISSLQDMFASHGLHESLASNNGTRFIATEFTEYMVQQGIRYHKVTGKWPQANEEGACWKWSKFAHAVKKNCIKGRDEFLPCGLYQGFPHAATGPRVQLYYFLDGKYGQTLWAERYKECMIYIVNLFYALLSGRSYWFVYRRTWRAMRILTRTKVGDTLPGSSATREERQAHNLVVSPVYKSVWAWFDSIPHCCKTSTVTAWWCSLEMEPKSLMQHHYCQETATESYIKCIMCTARVGNDDVPNI